MPDARITTVGDALVADVLATWAADRGSPVAAPDECERLYLTPVDLGRLTGRKVWVTPAAFLDEAATRRLNRGEYTFAVIVAERYPAAGLPPKAWLDERVRFVELLYDRLGSFGNERASGWLQADGHPGGLWTERAAVGEVYSFDYLDRHHVFWAELELEFRGDH